MKAPHLIVLLLAFCAVAPVARGEDFLPKAPPTSRYDKMADRSPFTPPTVAVQAPPVAPVGTGPHWWDQLFVTSLMQKGGIYYAGLTDRQSGKHYVLEAGKPDDESHFLLASVQWADRTDETSITVRRDAEVAPPLRFDTTALPVPAVAAPGRPTAPLPISTGISARGKTVLAATPTPAPPPGTNGVIRRTGPIAARPPAGVPGNAGTVRAPGNPQPPVIRRPLKSQDDDDDDD